MKKIFDFLLSNIVLIALFLPAIISGFVIKQFAVAVLFIHVLSLYLLVFFLWDKVKDLETRIENDTRHII
jgi:hypothetical protein